MSSRSSLVLMVPPTRPVPRPRIVTASSRFLLSLSSRRSLAKRHCCHSACNCIESSFGSFGGQLLLEMPRQREIDVVAAQQDVLADGDALELQLARLFGDRDEREVGGAAADVDHQDQIAHLHALAPIGMPLDPGVEGGLRLFEQQQVLVAGLFGGLQRQLACDRVERCRHCHQNFLLRKRRVGHFRVPSGAQVFQIAIATHPLARSSCKPSGALRAAAPRCDRRRHATARISPKPPVGSRLPPRASAPECQ